MINKNTFLQELSLLLNNNHTYKIIDNDGTNIQIKIDDLKFKIFENSFKNILEKSNLNLIYFNQTKDLNEYILASYINNSLELLKLKIHHRNNFEIKTPKSHKNNGFTVSFTGPDGSGKTTILELVKKELQFIYKDIQLNHFRPTVIPRIAELFNNAGLKKDVDTNYDKPHRGKDTGKINSLIRLFYYIFDYIYGYFKLVRPHLNKNGVVIFDRYYTDIVTDSKRSRINLSYKTILFFKKFVPNMHYNFLIYVNTENILNRKQELTKEQIEDIYEKLNYIAKNDSTYIKIDNNKNINDSVSEVINHIFVNEHKKHIKNL